MISLKTHNILDYCLGAGFLLAPNVFGFSGIYFAHDVFTVLGLATLGYSLLTDYRYSLFKAVPLSMHMIFDVVTGVFAILAPWVYSYQGQLTNVQGTIHWLFGLGAIMLAASTERGKEPPITVLSPEDEFFEEDRQQPKQAA